MTGYVALGSNLGDRLALLQAGLDGMARGGIVVSAVSSAWETEPVGTDDPRKFLNAAARIETDLAPETVLERLLEIETREGRVRTARNAPRPLDLDLLLLGDTRRDGPGLTIPHPRMWERAFVLVPLAEIAPGLVHPATGRSIGADAAGLAAACGCARAGRLALPRSRPVYSPPS